MDFTIEPNTVAIAEAVLRFVEREVLPLQQRHHDLLGSDRCLFDASGRYVPEVLALRQQVRKRSADRIAAIGASLLRPLAALARSPGMAVLLSPLGFASPTVAARFADACVSQRQVLRCGMGDYPMCMC